MMPKNCEERTIKSRACVPLIEEQKVKEEEADPGI
jgi:hypothetical protein